MNKRVCLILTIITFLHLSCGEWNAYKLYLIFDNVDGLTTKSEIKINGFTVGSIDKIELYKTKVLVGVTINRSITIPKHSVFELQNADLLGNKIINIKLDNSTAKYYNNDTIEGKVQSNFFMDSTIAKILQPITDTIANAIRDISKGVRKGDK